MMCDTENIGGGMCLTLITWISMWWLVCMGVLCVCVCVFIKLHITVCVCVCVFIKLHITAQSGPVILVILCHSH